MLYGDGRVESGVDPRRMRKVGWAVGRSSSDIALASSRLVAASAAAASAAAASAAAAAAVPAAAEPKAVVPMAAVFMAAEPKAAVTMAAVPTVAASTVTELQSKGGGGGGGGVERVERGESRVVAVPRAAAFSVGSRVDARYGGGVRWFPGK